MAKITKAKALRLIKSLKGKLAELTQKALRNCSWEEGKEPEFQFLDVAEEREKLTGQLVRLKSALAESNATSTVDFEGEEVSVQQAIFTLAELKGEISFYQSLHLRRDTEEENKRVMGPEGAEYVVVEHIFTSVYTESDREEIVAALKERIETLNDLIETHNHQTILQAHELIP